MAIRGAGVCAVEKAWDEGIEASHYDKKAPGRLAGTWEETCVTKPGKGTHIGAVGCQTREEHPVPRITVSTHIVVQSFLAVNVFHQRCNLPQ